MLTTSESIAVLLTLPCEYNKVHGLYSATASVYPARAAEGKEKWGSQTHPWRAREREPIMGVLGRSPQRGPGGIAPGGG